MSYIVIETVCPHCGHEEERFEARRDLDSIGCNACGKPTKRKPSAPKVDWDGLAMGNDASPEAIRHWEKKRRQRQAQEEKSKREHGDYGSSAGSD